MLSKKSSVSAQVTQTQAVTNSQQAKKSLSPTPPKGPRFRLMGTAAEMAESIGYDDFFAPEHRAARAYEKARAMQKESQEREAREPRENRERGQQHTPVFSSEYRGEGGNIATGAHKE